MSVNTRTEQAIPAISLATPTPTLTEEDGWLFRERHGVHVECVGRAMPEKPLEMTPPNQNRHNYPSV